MPGKLTTTSTWLSSHPRSVYFLQWDTDPDIAGGSFEFEPAEGAQQLEFDREFLPRDWVR